MLKDKLGTVNNLNLTSQASVPFTLHLSAIRSWGGGEQQLIYLYQELARNNVPQLIACQEGSALADYCKTHGLKFITYTQISGIDLKFAWQLKKLCTLYPIDIIHAHDAHTQTAALLAKHLFQIKPSLVISRKVAFPIKKSWLSRYKYNSRYIRKIICISQAVYQTLAPHIEDVGKLVIIPDGIDLVKFNSHTSKLRSELGLSSDSLLIGTVASLVASKDLFTFIKTAKQIIEQGVAVKFIIIGDGPLKSELQLFVMEQELKENIYFLGFRTDVAELLPQLNVFMLTSKQEGMGSSILEAMACKVPVVATRVGGIPEIVQHDKTGLLAEAGDVQTLVNLVKQLLNDTELRQRLITLAAQQVTKFTVEKMAEKTLAVYQTVLKIDSV